MTLLLCGHAASGRHTQAHGELPEDHPSCPIDIGLTAGACTPMDPPILEGRLSLCSYAKADPSRHQPVPSNLELPFFEYRGTGSRAADTICKNCRYSVIAHEADAHKNVCSNFDAIGPYEFDQHYCGCRGWD